MAGFTKKFVKRELIITMKSHNNNFPSVVFTLLRCVYGCLWPVACGWVWVCVCVGGCVCVCVCVCMYTKHRQQKFRAMNGAHLTSPIRGELGYAHWPQLGSHIHCPIGYQIWGPLGKQDVCPKFALTVGKFVFSNSGNFRAKANPPKPKIGRA